MKLRMHTFMNAAGVLSRLQWHRGCVYARPEGVTDMAQRSVGVGPAFAKAAVELCPAPAWGQVGLRQQEVHVRFHACVFSGCAQHLPAATTRESASAILRIMMLAALQTPTVDRDMTATRHNVAADGCKSASKRARMHPWEGGMKPHATASLRSRYIT